MRQWQADGVITGLHVAMSREGKKVNEEAGKLNQFHVPWTDSTIDNLFPNPATLFDECFKAARPEQA